MTNEFRAMCAELLVALKSWSPHGGGPLKCWEDREYEAALIARAEALLDQPELKRPKPVVDYSRIPEIATEAEIRSAAQYLVKAKGCDGDLIPAIEYAIARWGHPTPQPPATAEVAASLIELRSTVMGLGQMGMHVAAKRVERAADLLERQHPQPVAVSERLPGVEDCDAEGRCWMFGNVEGDWRLISATNSGIPKLKYCFSHWLPANALPTPEAACAQ